MFLFVAMFEFSRDVLFITLQLSVVEFDYNSALAPTRAAEGGAAEKDEYWVVPW